MKYGMAILLVWCFLLAPCGCGFGERWQKKSGDVSLIKEGMYTKDVLDGAGRPDYIVYGKGVRINWQRWFYPNGEVFFYRMQVKKVLKYAPGQERPKLPKDENYKDMFPEPKL